MPSDEDTTLGGAGRSPVVLANDVDVNPPDDLTASVINESNQRHTDRTSEPMARSPMCQNADFNGVDSFTYEAIDGQKWRYGHRPR